MTRISERARGQYHNTHIQDEIFDKSTFLFPPVIVTFTKRRVYVILFFARPLGVFFFSCGSTYFPPGKENLVSFRARSRQWGCKFD